jgi:hypothetical protein
MCIQYKWLKWILIICLVFAGESTAKKKRSSSSSTRKYYQQKYKIIKKLHLKQIKPGLLESPKQTSQHGYKALMSVAADKKALHNNEYMIISAIDDKSVGTRLFAAMFLTYHEPQKLFNKLIQDWPDDLIPHVKKVIDLEKRNRVTFMIHLLKAYLIELRALKSKKQAIALGKKFNIDTKRLMYTRRGRRVLKDLQMEALFTRNKMMLDKVSEYYRQSGLWEIDPNSPDAPYRVLRYYISKAVIPLWIDNFHDSLDNIMRKLVVSTKDYNENEQALAMIEYISGITKTKISRKFMAVDNVLIEKEYDRCISSMLYFAAQRGYGSLMKATSLLEEPARIYMRTSGDKKTLIKMCVKASPEEHKIKAKFEIMKLVKIGRP